MCDTLAVVRPDGVLFAKNSDRDPNEPQLLEWHAAAHHPAGEGLRCTWIEIPQVTRTHAVLISRPFWMWGAEIGSNEHGVTIGNEAVFTHEPYAQTGLTGMDLLRLALERAETANRAVEVIVELLEKHGQGGGCGHEHRDFTYHNSFIVADPGSAWVFETAGRHWETERIEGARSISNGLTIPAFARRHHNEGAARIAGSPERRARTSELGERAGGAADLMAILRDHGAGRRWPEYDRVNGCMDAPCVHAGGEVVSGQSTASWVAEFGPRGNRHWATATAAPCLSLFKPVAVDTPLDWGSDPDDCFDTESLWWRHEVLHRRLIGAPEEIPAELLAERDSTESRWLADPPPSAVAFVEHDQLLAQWTKLSASRPLRDVRPDFVRSYWDERNSRAGLEIA